MKREPPAKPPSSGPHPKSSNEKVYSSPKENGILQERNYYSFSPGCDNFQGVAKRVSDMTLTGSFDSEEPSAESEKSESSSVEHSKRHRGWGSSSCEGNSVGGSTCGDESSSCSFGGSDHCPPYEEIPAETCGFAGPLREKDYMNLPTYHSQLGGRGGGGGDGLSECGEHRRLGRRDSSRYSETHGNERKDGGDAECRYREEEGVTETEKHQIETFFRGLRTDLFVCSSLANLYVGWKDIEGKWAFKHTGVPVILLDRGDTKSRSKKKIQILLAERGTCFPLWKDTIDNLTSYRKAGEAFHTMHLSSDHRQVIGLSFDSSEESDHFYDYVSQLTANPENINISVPGSKKSKKGGSRKHVQLPHKDEISNPCLFEHVTSVAAKDTAVYMSLQTLLDKELLKQRENIS